MVEFDPVFLIAILASIVTTVTGFFFMFSIIRAYRRDAKEDTRNLQKESETRLKEHIDNKLAIVDNNIDNLKGDIKKSDEAYNREFNGFRSWVERVERSVKNAYYKSAARNGPE